MDKTHLLHESLPLDVKEFIITQIQAVKQQLKQGHPLNSLSVEDLIKNAQVHKKKIFIDIDVTRWSDLEKSEALPKLEDHLREKKSTWHVVLVTHQKAQQRPNPTQEKASSGQSTSNEARPHHRKGSQKPQPLPQVRFIVLVASGKGGVGKSTTAIHLTRALEHLGKRVGILDADLYGPSLARGLGFHEKRALSDGKILTPFSIGSIKALSIASILPEDAPAMWRGPMTHQALQQLLWRTSWGPLDVLVIDMPPGTGDIPLSLAQLVPITGAIMVTTAQELALADVRRCWHLFERLSVPVLGVVETMGRVICPHCHEDIQLFGQGGGQYYAQEKQVEFLGHIPFSPKVFMSTETGQSLQVQGPEFAVYVSLAQNLWDKLAKTS